MDYISAKQAATLWGISERSVRNYCAQGRIDGAFLTGKTWTIPAAASKPDRANKKSDAPKRLLDYLKTEKAAKVTGGIYHKIQIELTYNSSRIEGSRLSHDQTRFIYETNSIGADGETMNVDDIMEAANHFRCIDFVIDHARDKLSEKLIKQLHGMLKSGTSDSRRDWFAAGDYKRLPNEVGGKDTTPPERVAAELAALLAEYRKTSDKSMEELIDFHYRFEVIHPFQDGNGRVGRLILFKECLKYNIVPFIIDNDMKLYYYRGLQNWPSERGWLNDTCLAAQDKFKKYLDYFRIPY
ncbi:MAG: Fic family protein [Synergistaceae bacterium]|nr:Fic family protein [Synergistaceae bacterium]